MIEFFRGRDGCLSTRLGGEVDKRAYSISLNEGKKILLSYTSSKEWQSS